MRAAPSNRGDEFARSVGGLSGWPKITSGRNLMYHQDPQAENGAGTS